MNENFKLGISTCLMGESVRYDGGHKLDRYLVNILGKYIDYVPVCPEVESGFSIPREAFRLVGDPDNPRLITVRSKVDYTEKMVNWAKKRVIELESENLCGFIFKSKSPSSGYRNVKVYNEKGMPIKKGVGIFARIFTEHFPLLPAEDEGRLNDDRIRENFIERIFVMKRWRDYQEHNPNLGGLVDFHTKHKLLILSHSQTHYRKLGRLVAEAKKQSLANVLNNYLEILLNALELKTTVKKNINVLQHLLGYFKKNLSSDEKQEMLELIENYKNGYIPLIVPITLFNHFSRKFDENYLKQQYYLNPHPLELKLRNHV